VSLDGYVADRFGSFDWAEPDPDVHGLVNELQRPIGTYLYGRRMYEVMAPWETMPLDGQSRVVASFAELWRAADKVVYSRTLSSTSTARTRVEANFDPDAVRAMKAAATKDLSIGGPTLAARALAHDLVDEIQLFMVPTIVGGGNRWLPEDLRLDLELLDERRFASGFVHVRYRVRT